MSRLLKPGPLLWAFALLAVAYPLIPGLDDALFQWTGESFARRLTPLFCYAILALGLNVIVGNAGLLHIGIGAFFGIGAYITGVLMVEEYPFQVGFYGCLVASTLGAALLGILLSAPVLRLRGDYFALVTLGFGEVMRFTLRNLEEITAGTRGLKPIPNPQLLPAGMPEVNWANDASFYYLTLAFLVLVLVVLRNLERSAIGRAWVALREDELAAASMGLNVARLKLGAIALGTGLAGLGGCLFAFVLRQTSDPDQYGFPLSIMMICCLILGGVGNRAGVLLGVFLIFGYDNLMSPIADRYLQETLQEAADPAGEIRVFGLLIGNTGSPYLNFSGWRLALFGLALILVMRFRPTGLLPARRGTGKEA